MRRAERISLWAILIALIIVFAWREYESFKFRENTENELSKMGSELSKIRNDFQSADIRLQNHFDIENRRIDGLVETTARQLITTDQMAQDNRKILETFVSIHSDDDGLVVSSKQTSPSGFSIK